MSIAPPRVRRLPVIAPRQGQLELEAMKGSDFMALVAQQARSEESGSISSQYEQELLSNDAMVGALALKACNSTMGAISYGLVPLPRERGKFSLRIDVVVTRRHCRRLGIGTLLSAAVLSQQLGVLGENLYHASVMAVHPAMIQVFSKLGFERAAPNVPLYSRVVQNDHLETLHRQTERVIQLRMRDLRTLCVDCRRSQAHQPWCVAEA